MTTISPNGKRSRSGGTLRFAVNLINQTFSKNGFLNKIVALKGCEFPRSVGWIIKGSTVKASISPINSSMASCNLCLPGLKGCRSCCRDGPHFYVDQREYFPVQGGRMEAFEPMEITFRKGGYLRNSRQGWDLQTFLRPRKTRFPSLRGRRCRRTMHLANRGKHLLHPSASHWSHYVPYTSGQGTHPGTNL